MAGANSRRAAADLLLAVLEQGKTLDDALLSCASFDKLAGADRGFARAMASTTLRHLGAIDKVLETFLSRPLASAPAEGRALLRVGAAQIWCLETASHAAVSETVNAAKDWPKAKRMAGLLNAVLRKVSDSHDAFDSCVDTDIWPAWLQEAFKDSLGSQRTSRLAAAQRTLPHLHLTARNGEAAQLAEALGGNLSPSGQVELATTNIDGIDGFDRGEWWVQDPAAALPVKLMSFEPGDHVIDMCAAPGGKTMQLAARGATVIALDRSKKRLERVRENLARTQLGEAVTCIASPAEDWMPERPPGAILLDAPCSALGTLRRHPEGAWIKRPESIASYPEVQARLLHRAIEIAESGAEIIYCVCSPLRAEGVDVVSGAIDRGGVLRRPVSVGEVPGFEGAITSEGDMLTIPNGPDAQHDAFFIARLSVR